MITVRKRKNDDETGRDEHEKAKGKMQGKMMMTRWNRRNRNHVENNLNESNAQNDSGNN